MQVVEADKSRIRASRDTKKYISKAILVRLSRQLIPVGFTNIPIKSVKELPEEARKQIEEFKKYVEEVDRILNSMGVKYYLKLSYERIRCVYKNKKNKTRVYVPSDVIVILYSGRGDEIAILPSIYTYVEVRKNGEIVTSLNILGSTMDTIKLLKTFLEIQQGGSQ